MWTGPGLGSPALGCWQAPLSALPQLVPLRCPPQGSQDSTPRGGISHSFIHSSLHTPFPARRPPLQPSGPPRTAQHRSPQPGPVTTGAAAAIITTPVCHHLLASKNCGWKTSAGGGQGTDPGTTPGQSWPEATSGFEPGSGCLHARHSCSFLDSLPHGGCLLMFKMKLNVSSPPGSPPGFPWEAHTPFSGRACFCVWVSIAQVPCGQGQMG